MNQKVAQELAARAQHLIAIKNSPSWPVVRDLMQTKIDKHTNTYFGADSLSNEKLHYGRGYIQGMRVMLLMVEAGEQEYERAIKNAQALEGAEET